MRSDNLSALGVKIYYALDYVRASAKYAGIFIFVRTSKILGLYLPETFRGKPLRRQYRMWFYRVSYHQWLWGHESFVNALRETQSKREALLKEWADPLCPHCYGRGHQGFNERSETFVVCKCVRKRIDEARRAQKAGGKIPVGTGIVDQNGNPIKR